MAKLMDSQMEKPKPTDFGLVKLKERRSVRRKDLPMVTLMTQDLERRQK